MLTQERQDKARSTDISGVPSRPARFGQVSIRFADPCLQDRVHWPQFRWVSSQDDGVDPDVRTEFSGINLVSILTAALAAQ